MINSLKPTNNQDWYNFLINGELTIDFLRLNPLDEN